MSFDLSRKMFNPLDDYFGVVMQQGRVQLDTDWNAMVAQLSRRIQAESLDTFGPSIVPRETPNGFLISGPTTALEIGPGRIYVDGLLAENHTDTLKWDARLAEISGTARLSGADVDAAPSDPAGTTAYDSQPYYPNPPLPTSETYLVYVDIWQRDITYLQDASLVDAAVGADTTARQQTVWQVKFLNDIGALDPTTADVDIPGWLETIHPSSARLSTATGDLVDDENPCLLPPQAGYKGLENQLYRVQVHAGGPVGTATFKWSRENTVVTSRVSAISGGNKIVVDSLGRDDVLGFHDGGWVEVTDDHRDLMGLAGELHRIDTIDKATRTITLGGDPLPVGPLESEFPIDGSNQTDPTRNTRIIRWDQTGIVFREDESEHTNLDATTSSGAIEIPTSGTRLFLEKGILVDFDLEAVVNEANFAPEFKVGDYWIFSARVNDASIELLDSSPPMGIHHHYAKLAIVNDSGIDDCRTLWPPEVGGESCACTVCVHPDTHNNGTATIQQALDHVKSLGGGTVCLSVGDYKISQPIRITGNSVTLRGQGWETRLISSKQTTLIEIGGVAEGTDDPNHVMNITVENLYGLTSTSGGFNTAITVNNVIGLNLTECYIWNEAKDGTSHGIQFTDSAAMVAVRKCILKAEQGIIGPRLQKDKLNTMDFSVRDCFIDCSQKCISFTGASAHMNKFDFSNNHISNARDAGIELTGLVHDNTAVNIENNLFSDCLNGIISSFSNLRILCNDLELESDGKNGGNAITFVEGEDPGDSENLQVIGNRIRNYKGHAITVRTGIEKMMVKQNQIENIFGAAFVIEAGGSVNYLSLENNQFRDVDGVIPEFNVHAAVFLQTSVRADITNNVFDHVVRSDDVASRTKFRAGILVANSGTVRITGNRLFAVTPAVYSGLGAGIMIASKAGSFEVNDNEVSRVWESADETNERLEDAQWHPLMVNGTNTQRSSTATVTSQPTATSVGNTLSDSGVSAPLLALMENVPVVSVNNEVYAVLATRLVNLRSEALVNSSINVNGNRFDGSGALKNTVAVIITVPVYCGFSDNEVKSTSPGTLVELTAKNVAVNNNRLTTFDDIDILFIQARSYVVMGNMSTGNIKVSEDDTFIPLPDPWKPLNTFFSL